MAIVSNADNDLLLPFHIEGGAVRGRLVRLGAALDRILGGHDYPSPVAALMAETLALAAALAGSLKYDGIFSLQAQGDGPVSLVVADVTSAGHMRGYVRFDTAKLPPPGARADSAWLLGRGHLAFTVDQGPHTDRYQGIVELRGDSLAACAHQYFRQSEQLETAITLAARREPTGWKAGALMIQRMPAANPRSPIMLAEDAEETWRRAEILMGSLRQGELLDIDPDRLLYRLYHADHLVTSTVKPLEARCRCSPERVRGTLRSFPRDEVESLVNENGDVVVTCEFCKEEYVFNKAGLDALYG
ncbi:MAG: Hsp33 family molecular chaperone HslO [Rhodospirillales bacterium]|nr:Hsp33 family molecular chaperone HslO [Rhodospirillales bacterium]